MRTRRKSCCRREREREDTTTVYAAKNNLFYIVGCMGWKIKEGGGSGTQSSIGCVAGFFAARAA